MGERAVGIVSGMSETVLPGSQRGRKRFGLDALRRTGDGEGMHGLRGRRRAPFTQRIGFDDELDGFILGDAQCRGIAPLHLSCGEPDKAMAVFPTPGRYLCRTWKGGMGNEKVRMVK